MSAEVRAGYKQTEMGVIPGDWQIVSFAEATQIITCGVAATPKYVLESVGKPFLSAQNVRDGRVSFDQYKFIGYSLFDQITRNNKPMKGDLLYTRVGAGIGDAGVVESDIEFGIYVSLTLIRTDSKRLNNYFAAYLLNSPRYRFLAKGGQYAGGGVQNLNVEIVRKFVIPLPPIAEQRAIATALSDVDALLAKLDALIAKKRDLKVATMQQLLTAQTRLPGFSGEWEVKRLGDICEIGMGRTPPRLNQAYWGRGYKWLSIADLHTKIASESKEEVTELAASMMSIIPKGTLLMSFKLSLGRLCFAGCDLFTNEAICSFNKLQAIPDFLYYVLGRTDFSLYGKQAVKGYTLNKQSLKLVEVPFPPLPEQTAIAKVLSDMDTELTALEARRDKTRALKQGMMQELLTGRIRLN